MPDKRPLSERFDLAYVRRRSWPNNWTRAASLVLMVLAAGYIAFLALRGDQQVYTAGELTHGHATFGQDCAKCHQPPVSASGKWNYLLPISDSACLQCHVAAAHPDPHRALYAGEGLPIDGHLAPVVMSGNCVACHTDHRGRDFDIKRVSDSTCVQCHGNLAGYLSTPVPHTAQPHSTTQAATQMSSGGER